ncbi:BPSS1187 family protein [Archangium lansingense]|uniref:BPSS1187 family protein n=1 Tax=Archangium lansingense TaxID=2995310 RepID=UPI003B78F4C7
MTPRAPLVVFLPGTHMEPDKHDLVLATAAYAGYRTIGLSYENRVSVKDACSGANPCGNDCQGLARMEAVLGTDVSSEANIERGDSVLERLYRVLEYLDANDPAGGWSSYYVPTAGNITSASIVWSQIIISGFSQGAGHAALISRKMQVHGLFIIDGGNDTCNGAAGPLPAEWTTLLPDASSGRRKYGVTHRRNEPMPYAPSATWQALGLGTSGTSLDGTGWGRSVIDTIPPMPFSYTNQSFAKPPAQCSEHTSMARDECMPANLSAAAIAATAPGSRLFAPYLRRFCYACDPGTCP